VLTIICGTMPPSDSVTRAREAATDRTAPAPRLGVGSIVFMVVPPRR